MPKVMLVEDDNNLSEIYQARMQAEGYEIVAASDGEEALAVAAKEKPDLIISDVMMPKISGFEMLDILRNTDGLKNTKVIMLTALGQAEDQTRADKLGANRYLVKSQVTLEDIVKAAQELLAELDPGTEAIAAPVVADSTTPAPASLPTASKSLEPTGPYATAPVAAEPTTTPVPVAENPVIPVASAPQSLAVAAEPTPNSQQAAPAANPAVIQMPPVTMGPLPVSESTTLPVSAAPEVAPTTPNPISVTTQPVEVTPAPSQTAQPVPPMPEPSAPAEPAGPAQSLVAPTPLQAVPDEVPPVQSQPTAATPQSVTPQPAATPPAPTASDSTATTPALPSVDPPATPVIPPPADPVDLLPPAPAVVQPAATPTPQPLTTPLPTTTPEPATPSVTSTPTPPTASTLDDQVMNDAISKLLASTGEPTTPAAAPAVASAPPQVPTPSTPPPALSAPKHAVNMQTNNDDIGESEVVHKKIINPISDLTNRPDLDKLLAAEEAKYDATPQAAVAVEQDENPSESDDDTMPVLPAPGNTNHQPGTTVAPQPSSTAFDPNSISL